MFFGKLLFRQISLIFFLLVCALKTFSQEVLPSGCSAVVVKSDILHLESANSIYTFIHNLSEHDIWLVSQGPNDYLSAKLSSKIAAGAWSSLVLHKDSKSVEFSCIESRPGHEQKISCREVLAVCEWRHTQIPENLTGAFFVVQSMDLASLMAYSERNGYSLS